MFPEGAPDIFSLAEIIAAVKDEKFLSVQHMATAYGQGDRWAKQVFRAAKANGLLPSSMTPAEWGHLFPATRKLSAEQKADQAQRRAHLRAEFFAIYREEREEKKRRILAIRATHRAAVRATNTQARVAERASARAKYKAELRAMQEAFNKREAALRLEHGDLELHWVQPRTFEKLSIEFIRSSRKYEDLKAEEKIIVKEKLADVQRGVCDICRKPFSPDRKPCLDHCHETGKIRGMLCCFCNLALGGFNDSILSLENAIKYLLEHSTIRLSGTA